MKQVNSTNQPPLFALGIGAIIIIAIGSWWGLVHRVDATVEETYARAIALEAEVTKGRDFLAGRSGEKLILESTLRTAEDLRRRIPNGRQDLQVAQHFEKAATLAGVLGFAYDVVGGMALTKTAAVEKEKTPNELLDWDPSELQSVDIMLEFTGSYSQLVSMLRAAYESSWHIEIKSFEQARTGGPSLNMKTRIHTRYYYK